MTNEISEFGAMLLFIIGGLAVVAGGLFTGRIIRSHKPNEEKLTTYECGEEPLGGAWVNFNLRFYIIALIFLLFDVEIVLLFPWATVFGRSELINNPEGGQYLWGWFSLTEAFIFVFILVLGLVYAWAKGHLDWIRPVPEPTPFKGKVPMSLYEEVNKNVK